MERLTTEFSVERKTFHITVFHIENEPFKEHWGMSEYTTEGEEHIRYWILLVVLLLGAWAPLLVLLFVSFSSDKALAAMLTTVAD